jgi:hypothetical protein
MPEQLISFIWGLVLRNCFHPNGRFSYLPTCDIFDLLMLIGLSPFGFSPGEGEDDQNVIDFVATQ